MEAADVPQVLEIAAAAEAFDGVAALDEAAVLALRNRPDTAFAVLTGRSGPLCRSERIGTSLGASESGAPAAEEPVGFALLLGSELSVVVAPDARGAGLGTALVEAALAEAALVEAALVEAQRSRQGGDVAPDRLARDSKDPAMAGSLPVTAWMHGDSPAGRALAAHFGFVATRELWVMRRARGVAARAAGVGGIRDSSGPKAGFERAEGGIRLRGFAPGDEAEILRVNATAFSWHPEQGSMDLANLQERMAQPWFDPAGLIEAWEVSTRPAAGSTGEAAADESRLLGFHWTKRHPDSPDGTTHGEIYVVGVDPAAQGRGLGRLLTVAGLEHMRELDEVLLYVEADNYPAVRLYESLGFTHAPIDTHVQFVGAAS